VWDCTATVETELAAPRLTTHFSNWQQTLGLSGEQQRTSTHTHTTVYTKIREKMVTGPLRANFYYLREIKKKGEEEETARTMGSSGTGHVTMEIGMPPHLPT